VCSKRCHNCVSTTEAYIVGITYTMSRIYSRQDVKFVRVP
jgi:hypothetical protein